MLDNPDVEFVGVFEPDMERRSELEGSDGPYHGVRWFDDAAEMLEDPTIVAIASEGRNIESLDQTEEIVQAGKHVWYDKPAGDDWDQWQRVLDMAGKNNVVVQMGYMWRYHEGFCNIAEWVKSGMLGDIFALRAHVSTSITEPGRVIGSRHPGGIMYDLGSHVIDQIVWLLGRPTRVTSFLRNDTGIVPEFSDNTLAVLEYERAMVYVDIAAMETTPPARRFEVYGTRGSAIMEPFEPTDSIRLNLAEAQDGYEQGVQTVTFPEETRHPLYGRELESFLSAIGGERQPDRSIGHELLVQETLLRATGRIE
jgi:scyllo-inositol 2-dehydrogenase (NADP+)